MEKTELTPEQSLTLIAKTIDEAKNRFQENGGIFIFWGTITFVVFGSQLILSLLELYDYTIYPVYLFPLGGLYMIYAWRQVKSQNMPKTIISRILQHLGWIVGLNLLTMGFLFTSVLGDATASVFLILLAILIMVSGIAIKFKALTISGILLNLIALANFLINVDYHGISMMVGAVVGLIIPGILLNIARRKENV